MQAYLVDTNILIYQLSGQLLPTSRELLKDLLEENKAHISVITRIEVLGWRLHTAESQMLAQRLLQQFQEMPLARSRDSPLHSTSSNLCNQTSRCYYCRHVFALVSPANDAQH